MEVLLASVVFGLAWGARFYTSGLELPTNASAFVTTLAGATASVLGFLVTAVTFSSFFVTSSSPLIKKLKKYEYFSKAIKFQLSSVRWLLALMVAACCAVLVPQLTPLVAWLATVSAFRMTRCVLALEGLITLAIKDDELEEQKAEDLKVSVNG
jgi:hypothetical protein